jgi:hypothetical protein
LVIRALPQIILVRTPRRRAFNANVTVPASIRAIAGRSRRSGPRPAGTLSKDVGRRHRDEAVVLAGANDGDAGSRRHRADRQRADDLAPAQRADDVRHDGLGPIVERLARRALSHRRILAIQIRLGSVTIGIDWSIFDIL